MKNYSTRYRRNSFGSSLAELGPALIVVIPILGAIFEMALLVNGVKINDSAAAEAVRLVAAGDPTNAMQRAQVVIDHANQQSFAYASEFSLMAVNFLPVDVLAQETKMSRYGGTLTGTVTVTTQLIFRPLGTAGPAVTIDSKKSCPFTYNVPNTAGGLPVNPQ